MRNCHIIPVVVSFFCRDRDGERIFEILRTNRQQENRIERRKERKELYLYYDNTKPPSTTRRVNHYYYIRQRLILCGLTSLRRRKEGREKKSSEDSVAGVVFVFLNQWIPSQQFICESRVVCSDHYRLRKSSAHTTTTQRFLSHSLPLRSHCKHALHVHYAVYLSGHSARVS